MRIHFKHIDIHNFKSFADESFDFDKYVGLNLICGKNRDILNGQNSSNGSGKSNLSSALCFALYGQTPDNIKNGNVYNRFAGTKEMRIVLTFNIDDVEYKISSGFNKHGAPYCEVIQFDDNGAEVDLTKSTLIETRQFIANEILHCDLSIFLRTVLLSSDHTYNFFELSKHDKKVFIEKLFDIQVFGSIYDSIHKDILQLDKTIVAKQNTLMVLNQNKSTYADLIRNFNDNKSKKLSSLEQDIAQLEASQTQLKSTKIETNTNEVEKYEAAIQKLDDMNKKLQDASSELARKSDKIDVSISKMKNSIESKQKIISKHQDLLVKLCDDCKKTFSDYYNITSYANEIEKMTADVAELSQKKDTIAESINLNSSKSIELQHKKEKALAKIRDLTKEATKANAELNKVETQLIRLQHELNSLNDSQNPYEKLLLENDDKLEAESTQLNSITDNYKYLKFAENIVSQDTLRKFIINDLVGLLNNKIQTYLTKFGAKYHVKFDADMNYEFITSGGNWEFNNFSAGERARIMIASCFAFRDFMYIRNNFSSNVLILDEFIDGAIDSVAIENILELLKNFSSLYKQNISVISHRKEIDNSIFDSIIQIVKKDNISHITYLPREV